MATYYVKYKGYKRTMELTYHTKAQADEKAAFLARHGIKCRVGRYADK